MRAATAAVTVTAISLLQVAAAVAVAVIVGARLDAMFMVQGVGAGMGGTQVAACALSWGSSQACNYSYAAAAVGIFLSLVVVGAQCATLDGSSAIVFCAPVFSVLGFGWWAAYAAVATVTALRADDVSSELHGWRTAVWALAWTATALFAATFFLSAATVTAAADEQEEEEQGWASPIIRALSQSRVCERIASRLSPQSTRRQGSPKKFVQPRNANMRFPLTSNGRRTFVVVEGMPVALSCDATPCSSAGASLQNTPRAVQAMLLGRSLLASHTIPSHDLSAALLPASRHA